ncbi:MAG: hypothetical protein MUF87_06775 [Anaerolineae bacterium]|jgi:Tol biopolymer transport system component|nr:hypothetical protein [Anaerolineae bacterium]
MPFARFLFRFTLLFLTCLVVSFSVHAQDAVNLPTELYVLLDDGRVERFGLGASGSSKVTPEDQIVIDFGVAPDGAWIAYRTDLNLQLLNMITGQSLEIEGASAGFPPYRGNGQTLVWSPDGSAIAYTMDYGIRAHFLSGGFTDIPITPILDLKWSPDGRYLLARAEQNIWWVYRREGTQLILNSAIPSSFGAEWVGGPLLMLAPETGGLFLMDVTNNAQSELATTDLRFQMPALRRDGSVSVFAQPITETEINPVLYRITPTTDGATVEPFSENPVDLANLSWFPDGSLLVALSGGVIGLVEPVSGQGYTLPITGVVMVSWGALRPIPETTLTLSQTLHLLAADLTGVVQLWELGDDPAIANPITPADVDVTDFAISRDGSRAVYVSDNTLFLTTISSGEITPLGDATGLQHFTFNPDGQTIAYDDGAAIYLRPAGEGEAEQLINGYLQPRYSPDGSAFLVRIVDGDLALFTPASGEVRRLGAYTDALWLQDGRIALFGTATPNLQLLDPTSPDAPIDLYTPPAGFTVIDVAQTVSGALRVLVARDQLGPSTLEVFNIALNGSTAVSLGIVGYLNLPQFSDDGRLIAGYGSGARGLVIYNLETQRETILILPSFLTEFRWTAFR